MFHIRGNLKFVNQRVSKYEHFIQFATHHIRDNVRLYSNIRIHSVRGGDTTFGFM